MKRLSLLAVAVLTFARASFAGAPPPDAAATAEARIKSELVEPLAAKERDQSRFSRARMPAQERRVRVLDEKPRIDAQGAAFYTFAIDARHGVRGLSDEDNAWKLSAISGCAYVDGKIFVQNGERHRPAAFLLGKNLKAVDEHICRAANPAS